ncbi:hypothetical protein [Kitasatospora sp. NPDC090308]
MWKSRAGVSAVRAVARRLGMVHDPAADFLDPGVLPVPQQRAAVYRPAGS